MRPIANGQQQITFVFSGVVASPTMAGQPSTCRAGRPPVSWGNGVQSQGVQHNAIPRLMNDAFFHLLVYSGSQESRQTCGRAGGRAGGRRGRQAGRALRQDMINTYQQWLGQPAAEATRQLAVHLTCLAAWSVAWLLGGLASCLTALYFLPACMAECLPR